MLNIRSYKDGDTLVVAIDGLEKLNEDDIAKTFLSSLTQSKVETAPNPAALPVKKNDAPPVKLVRKFESGPFQGKSPKEIMDAARDIRAKDVVCKRFSNILDNIADPYLRQDIIDASRVYLRERFSGSNADEYCEKLTQNQVLMFYMYYSPFATTDVKHYLCAKYQANNWTSFLFSSDENLKAALPYILRDFQ